MPIAIATIPESTAHMYQLEIYINDEILYGSNLSENLSKLQQSNTSNLKIITERDDDLKSFKDKVLKLFMLTKIYLYC